jgi:hypothetical protein
MRGAVTQPRTRTWQILLDWFRPVAREASIVPQRIQAPYRAIDGMGPSNESGAEAVLVEEEAGHGDLLEFLAADLDPVPADPVFREELREQLWALVQDGTTARPKDH